MQWIIENWLTLLLIGGMLAMHLFGHGHAHGRKKRSVRPPVGNDQSGAETIKPGDEE